MTISITERTGEIGLLRALCAKRSHVLTLFVGEAIALSVVGVLPARRAANLDPVVALRAE